MLAVLAGIALAAPGGAAAARHKHYPPRALWYRVALEFDGLVTRDDSELQTRPEIDTWEGKWKLKSRTAVRLTLGCANVNPRLGAGRDFFTIRRRIRGKKRRVGGCPHPTKAHPRKRLRPSVRFAAGANGELTSWSFSYAFPAFSASGCDWQEYSNTGNLLEKQALVGQISSASSRIEGITFNLLLVDLHNRSLHVIRPDQVCTRNDGTTLVVPGGESTINFPPDYVFGDEDYFDGEPLAEMLRFGFPPKKFGKAFSDSGSYSQPQDNTRHDPGSIHFVDEAAKTYTYTIRFKPCPRHGRNVKRC